MTPDEPTVLAIDDEWTALDFLQKALPEFGFEVVTVNSGQEGLDRYAKGDIDIVLVDLSMPEMDGFEVIRQLTERDENAMAVVMTGSTSIQSALQAMKVGAADYLTKPLDLDHLEMVLKRAIDKKEQSHKIKVLEQQVVQQGSFEGLIGVSAQMQGIYDIVRQLGENDATVLLQGETGTGKEMVARAVHQRSNRSTHSFSAVNCGALSENLLESELFGHEKGAFTGASNRKIGLIEQAGGGTLFLDEIQEMSPALQVKLLRTIQEREIRRVGGTQVFKVDLRLVAATNVDLRQHMESGNFRADLFYRLSVVVINLPALRDRKEDVPLLIDHFLAMQEKRSGRQVREIMPEAMMVLKAYPWPGNVRELENTIEQAVLLSKGEVLSMGDLPPQIMSSVIKEEGITAQDLGWYDMSLRDAREQFERKYLQEILGRAEGNVSAAARMAGINRQHFYQKMRRHSIVRK